MPKAVRCCWAVLVLKRNGGFGLALEGAIVPLELVKTAGEWEL